MKQIKFIIMAALLIFASCSVQKMTTKMTAQIVTKGMSAVESETDLWIADQSIVPMVKTLEVFQQGDPDSAEFGSLMAKVYGNVAFGFFETNYIAAKGDEKEIWRDRAERYYKLGYENGIKSLGEKYGKEINSSILEFDSRILKADKKDLSLLFWTAFDLGKWVNMNKDDIMSVALMPKAQSLIDRVLNLDRNYGFGSALSLKGAMLASRPKMLGGNPEEAEKIFQEAVSVSDGKYLMNRVMYAEWFAIPQNNYKLAKELLNEVLSADPLELKEQALANQIAQKRAVILLKSL